MVIDTIDIDAYVLAEGDDRNDGNDDPKVKAVVKSWSATSLSVSAPLHFSPPPAHNDDVGGKDGDDWSAEYIFSFADWNRWSWYCISANVG